MRVEPDAQFFEQPAELLDLRIEDGYSSEELGTIAIECPVSGMYHLMAESLHVEVLRPDGTPCTAGESGEVVVSGEPSMKLVQ